MNLKKLALESLNEIDFMNNDLKKYTNQSAKEYCFNNIPLGYEINFMFIEGEQSNEITARIIEKTEEYIEDEYRELEGEEECFIVKKDSDKFLVPLFEVEQQLNEFIKSNIEDYVNIDKFIKDNYGHLEELNDFNFLTDTQFAIELEGGWNGRLSLDNFGQTTDNSFEDCMHEKDHRNEFVYNGSATAEKVVKDLYENFPKLAKHSFEYTRTCGTHIHFSETGDNNGFSKEKILKLMTILTSIEDILFDIIPQYRVGTIDKLNGSIDQYEGGFSKSLYHREEKLLKTMQEIRYRLSKKQLSSKNIDRYMEKLMKSWYGQYYTSRERKYNPTRYYGINLHSFFYRGSMELRYFEGNYRNIIYYIDLVDKIMFLLNNFEWETIDKLLDKLDSYSKVSTKSCALLYALGISNKSLSKLLSRTDYSQLNIVKNHNLLNEIRQEMTDLPVELNIPDNYKEQNIKDTTCYPENIDKNADYTKRKYNVIEKIKNKKSGLKEYNREFDRQIVEEFTGQDKDEFMDYINHISQNIEGGN